MSGPKRQSFVKRFLIFVVILSAVVGIGFLGIEITCTPWFCNRCHEMGVYYETWGLCNHGSRTSCMKCHVQPGFLNFLKAKANGLFALMFHFFGMDKVEATLPVICLREGCHNLDTIDKMGEKKDRVDKVKMDHVKHVELMREIGTRYDCIPCHKNVAHGRQKRFMPDMKDTCFICHSDMDIRYKNCEECHPLHPVVEGEVEELYAIHKEAGVGCGECHIEAHKANEVSCLNCHDASYTRLTTFKIKGSETGKE